MNPGRRTAALAVTLASRPEGITAPELAERASCTQRAAQRMLANLAADGFLSVDAPERKGKSRGDWRKVYRTADTEGGPQGRDK
jgi:predicted ArsR family transcriptional regulator